MPEFKKIYCIIKLSELDYHHATERNAARFQKLGKELQEQIRDSHENQRLFIQKLKGFTEQYNLEVAFVPECEMDQISPTSEDLVISCGGDGTFLTCAQKFQNSPLLGMNSDYKPKAGPGSYGALTSVNRTNLERRLKQLIRGDYFIDHWGRLQVAINGERIDRYAVNDIYIGQKLAYQTCDITVKQSGIEQDFNCSGVLCCTGMGSHAWFCNAGGSPFSNEMDAFGFSLLFPNLKRSMKFSSGVVSSRHELVLIPQGDNYVISFDSKRDVLETELGDEIRVSLNLEKAVRVILFENVRRRS